MIHMIKCTFCGTEITKGTGKLYVKKDGKTFNFCSSKCEKNMIILKRIPRKIQWTEAWREQKSTTKKGTGKSKTSSTPNKVEGKK